MSAQRRVGVVYTGGTIGLRSIDPVLHPEDPQMLDLQEIADLLRDRSDLPDVTCRFLPMDADGASGNEPVPSSQILPGHWVRIARTIQRCYDDHDGFVVLHGTDTMAWTASALSFMLTNLSKPIVLTGSQRPIRAAPSDAVSNFVNAVTIAACAGESVPVIPEVVICFDDRVLRGNRATKISAASLQGFDTPNAPHLGRVGRRVEIAGKHVRPPPDEGAQCFARLRLEESVADVVLYPGMSGSYLRRLLKGHAGAVLRTFGAGNAPGGREVRAVLRDAVKDDGMVLVNVTQANEGTVEDAMVTGTRYLTDCGVVSGLDLTAEAAFTKLMVLLGSEPPDVVKQQMQLNQRGEQSLDLVELRGWSEDVDQAGVCRLQLTAALHARVRPERLRSAVLRLRLITPNGSAPTRKIRVHLSHWWADRYTDADPRTIAEPELRAPPKGPQEVVLDATDVCRVVLEAGAPVTLTIVSAEQVEWSRLEAVLSLFTSV